MLDAPPGADTLVLGLIFGDCEYVHSNGIELKARKIVLCLHDPVILRQPQGL